MTEDSDRGRRAAWKRYRIPHSDSVELGRGPASFHPRPGHPFSDNNPILEPRRYTSSNATRTTAFAGTPILEPRRYTSSNMASAVFRF